MPGRVFILGAGASHEDTKHTALAMPLANDFFLSEYLNHGWPIDYGIPKFTESNLATILSCYFRIEFEIVGNKIRSSKSVNIEEVLTFLENYENVYLSASHQTDIFLRAKKELLSYIHDVILHTPSHGSPEFLRRLSNSKTEASLKKKETKRSAAAFKFHNKILSTLTGKDSVITFNWDLIADSVLLANNKDHYFNLRDQLLNPFSPSSRGGRDLGYFSGDELHQGYYLKLHGSVNMACCINKECARHQFPILLDEFEAETPHLYFCNLCYGPLEILILPPLINKSFRANRFFKLQAGIAAHKLQIATEVIVIGYSFPWFDFEANSFMRLTRLEPRKEVEDEETFLEKIIIVNPQVRDGEYVRRVTDLFGIAHSRDLHGHEVDLVLYATISDFVDNYVERTRKTAKRGQ